MYSIVICSNEYSNFYRLKRRFFTIVKAIDVVNGLFAFVGNMECVTIVDQYDEEVMYFEGC